MKTTSHSCTLERIQGFDVYQLANEDVSLKVIPELGAKIIALQNVRSGREWLWHPTGGMKLFANRGGDDFSLSPLVGIDECMPTITPCTWQGRNLPDHGEVWPAKWTVDAAAWQSGVLRTSVRLAISPFQFVRTIELEGNEVSLTYQLTNLSTQEEAFLWAIHPLLKLQTGDQLELPSTTRELLQGTTWIDDIEAAVPENRCAKIFARPVTEGFAGIHNQTTGDRLEFIWEPLENDTLGLWLTRGGWHGHHHFAIEPTNTSHDALTAAATENCRRLEPGGSTSWQLRLRVSSSK